MSRVAFAFVLGMAIGGIVMCAIFFVVRALELDAEREKSPEDYT